jgi:hypothetical protein
MEFKSSSGKEDSILRKSTNISLLYHRQLKIRFSYFDDPKIIGHQCA